MLDQTLGRPSCALHEKGHGTRTIARMMKLSRGAVRGVVRAGTSAAPCLERNEKAEPHEAEILELYARCKGNLVRVHEELLAAARRSRTRRSPAYCRRHGIGYEPPPMPAGRYDFVPGEEMQHDTSPHDMRSAGSSAARRRRPGPRATRGCSSSSCIRASPASSARPS